ncbi:MAG: aryl-sulfate sulfotransferase [Planctomycetota bacterium]|nr:aryl-sulfate sulfotransferase [Planctomycetota bacterium]
MCFKTTGNLTLLLTLLFASHMAIAADPVLGWLGSTPDSFEGYTLMSPGSSTTTYLLDNSGRVVHSWEGDYRPGLSVYLLENGNLLRSGKVPVTPPDMNSGGWGGLFQLLDWDSNILWEYQYSNPEVQQHHDVEMLPSGNVLVLAWEMKSATEAIAQGRNPALLNNDQLWPDHIVEVSQTGPNSGEIVWEWHAWDHLIQDFDPAQANFGVVADHPELININAVGNNGSDWLHGNSIDYSPELDQIVISIRALDEIWIIDHGTTTAQAAGHTGGNQGVGGDLLYRWGNPQNYDSGQASDQLLFGQHCAEWIPPGFPGEGNISIFNNGNGRPGPDFSEVLEIEPPVDSTGAYSLLATGAYGPDAPIWAYSNPGNFFSGFISGARRLLNGNTIICDGPTGFLFEVTPAQEIVWSYEVPVSNGIARAQGNPIAGGNTLFRTQRFALDHPFLAGRDLTPGAPVETYPDPADSDGDGDVDLQDFSCFEQHFTGSGPGTGLPLYANAAGFYFDFDLDGDVDCDDADSMELIWTADPASFPEIPGCDSGVEFVRGDANDDGNLNIADAVSILQYLFSNGFLNCLQSSDLNDDESLDISDAVSLLQVLFGSGNTIPAPTGSCGLDPTPGGLSCDSSLCP